MKEIIIKCEKTEDERVSHQLFGEFTVEAQGADKHTEFTKGEKSNLYKEFLEYSKAIASNGVVELK